MNLNAIKTLILGSGLVTLIGPWLINFFVTLIGCTGDDPVTAAIEVAQCSGGDLFTIPVTLQKIVGGIVITLALALTAFFKGGTIKQNLLNKSAVVVKNDEPTGPGVVTEQQVATHT